MSLNILEQKKSGPVDKRPHKKINMQKTSRNSHMLNIQKSLVDHCMEKIHKLFIPLQINY